jgi:hypothetical protein
MKLDLDYIAFIDYLVRNLISCQMAVNDKNFYEALIYIMKNQELSRQLFDHYLCTLHARIFISVLLF